MLINGSAILLLPLADWQLLTSKRIQESLPIFNGSLCQKKCCIVESREDALSGQLTPTYHLLASTCWFEGVQNLVAPRHVLCVCIYIYMWYVCVHVHVVYVCVYIWHDMYPTTHYDFYTVGHYSILRLSKKTTRIGISKSPEDLCHFASAALMGLRFRFSFNQHQSTLFSTPIYEFYPIACWNMSRRFHIKQPSRNLHKNLNARNLTPGCNLMP